LLRTGIAEYRFYQKPDSWFGIGANDYSLRRCLETRVDIFREEK